MTSTPPMCGVDLSERVVDPICHRSSEHPGRHNVYPGEPLLRIYLPLSAVAFAAVVRELAAVYPGILLSEINSGTILVWREWP